MLLLQPVPLGLQSPDDVVVTLLRLAVEAGRPRLGLLADLLRHRPRVRDRLPSLLAGPVGVPLGLPNNLLRRRSRRGPDVVGLLLSAGDVVVGGSLGQGQDLQGPTLGVRIGDARRHVHGHRRHLHGHVVRGRSAEQSLDAALDPTIGHSTTSVLERSGAPAAAGRHGLRHGTKPGHHRACPSCPARWA